MDLKGKTDHELFERSRALPDPGLAIAAAVELFRLELTHNRTRAWEYVRQSGSVELAKDADVADEIRAIDAELERRQGLKSREATAAKG